MAYCEFVIYREHGKAFARCVRLGCRLNDRPIPVPPGVTEINAICTAIASGGESFPPSGPGTALARIIAGIKLGRTAGCGCDEMLAKMNSWGVSGCNEHRDEILAHLQRAYRELNPSWVDKAKMAAAAMAMGVMVNPLDPASSLLEAAISRAAE